MLGPLRTGTARPTAAPCRPHQTAAHIAAAVTKTGKMDARERPRSPSPVFNDRNRPIGEVDVTALLRRFIPNADVKVRDMSLYRSAFVHRSYAVPNNAKRDILNSRCPPGVMPVQRDSYERLEFLGDAVLGLVTAAYLFERYPDEDEGFMTQMRTKIINGRMLAALCQQTTLPQFVVVSHGTEHGSSSSPLPSYGGAMATAQRRGNSSSSSSNSSSSSRGSGATARNVLEDVFEAFLGAIYLDSGFDTARTWLIGFLEQHVDFAELAASRDSAKAVLNRHCMRTLGYVPTTEHLDNGVVRLVSPSGAVIATGKGADTKEAEAAAVRGALSYYGLPTHHGDTTGVTRR